MSWGKGTIENEIGWGQGDVNNDLDFGVSQFEAPSGDTNIVGISVLVFGYRDRIIADGGTVDSSLVCIQTKLNKI